MNTPTPHSTVSIWLWVALAELAAIIILLVLLRRRAKGENRLKRRFKSDALQQEVNMNEVMGNIFQARQLYDHLKRQCHPDRFTDPNVQTKANALFQQITENKRNYARLQELKRQAKQELNIHF